MDYKLILFVIVVLFIGANLMCSCCRYPIFEYIMGHSGSSIMEGNTNSNTGPPGSLESVKKANKDISEIMSKNQPVPPILNPPGKEGFLDMGGLPNVFQTGLNAVSGETPPPTEGFLQMGNVFQSGMDIISGSVGSGPASRDEKITVTNSRKEGMSTMGSSINETQNGDVASMWVSKANSYASDLGYGVMNNTGTSYTADEPLKNGEMVMFAKNKFKPECCPSPYSTSTGCVCMTSEQIHYLNTRGGNRTTDSGV